jgi:hypothetical protein
LAVSLSYTTPQWAVSCDGPRVLRPGLTRGGLRGRAQKGGYLGKQQATHKCRACGNHKFVLCELCNGRHKLYDDDGDQFECPDCNENGLVICVHCCVPS